MAKVLPTSSATVPIERLIAGASSVRALREAAASCHACELYVNATQTVFGEGAPRASLMLVGEQPGDVEDRKGHPFVGPAGGVLDRALAAAGLDREQLYITNAVKHFYFEHRGKARLHKKPKFGDVRACRPWLEAELKLVRPTGLVLLGATAAQSLLGTSFRVTRERGKILRTDYVEVTVATWHPSQILRAPDSAAREQFFQDLVKDLQLAKSAVEVPRGHLAEH